MIRGDDNNYGLDDGDDQQEEAVEVPETKINVELPKINVDLGEEQHFVKLPNFLSVETRWVIIQQCLGNDHKSEVVIE